MDNYNMAESVVSVINEKNNSVTYVIREDADYTLSHIVRALDCDIDCYGLWYGHDSFSVDYLDYYNNDLVRFSMNDSSCIVATKDIFAKLSEEIRMEYELVENLNNDINIYYSNSNKIITLLIE